MTGGAARYLNRELSWLEFNARVLAEAADERTPLLERLKFLAIFASNLDEFYMVRVAGLRRQLAAGVGGSHDGASPLEQLMAIDARVRAMLQRSRVTLHEVVLPRMREVGVRLCRFEELTPAEAERVSTYFDTQVYPVLTPLAVDPGHPFPYISNLSLSLAVELKDPDHGDVRFARVKVPKSLPRWVPTGQPGPSSRSSRSSGRASKRSSPGWRSSERTSSGSRATRTSSSRRPKSRRICSR